MIEKPEKLTSIDRLNIGVFSLHCDNGCGHGCAEGCKGGLLCCCAGEGDGHHGLDEGVDGVGHGVLADHGDNGC